MRLPTWRSSFRHFAYRLVGAAVLLALAAAGPSVGASAGAPEGHPVWDHTVATIMAQAEGPKETSQPEGHLGWDKATGRRLSDPTAQLGAQSPARLRALAGTKAASFAPGPLTYRSGFRGAATSGLQAGWLAQAASAGSGTPVYGVIQFPLPFDTFARQELEKAGARFYNYVEGGGLYVRLPGGAAGKLQSLAASGRVLFAGAIPAAARLDPVLASIADPEAPLAVTLQLFDPPDAAQMAQISQYLLVEAASLHPALPILQGSVRAADAATLAALPFVRWLEANPPAAPANLESTMAAATDVLRAGDLLGSTGAGVRVAMMDTGLMQNPSHADLPNSRVLDQYDFFPGNDDLAEDQYGHGTHITGIVGGSGTASGADLGLQGHAPEADFLIYRLCCLSGSGYFPAHFQQALIRGSQNGMNVSNISWGGGIGMYTTNAEIADRAVRGEYGRPVLVVASAGNDNNLVRSPGTGKNVITVGAIKSGNAPNQTIASCGDTNWPPGERVCFSNYGPIDTDGDGQSRVKPDLMADGVMVRSSIPFGYLYYNMTGTSMAAPAVTGAAAALLDHYSETAGWLFDWPETVKAMLLASATDLGGSPGLYGRGSVNAYQAGYGGGAFWGNALTATGEAVDFTFEAPSGYWNVRLALTWPDPAGGAEVANDLDLYVYSNGACAGSPVAASTTAADTVEFVSVGAGQPAGTWCAQVVGASLSSTQTFGLAVFPNLAAPALSLAVTVDDLTPAPGQTIYLYTTVANDGSAAPGSYTRLFVPPGFSLEGARAYTADGRSYYYAASELYGTGDGFWHVATGQVVAGFPRLVRWAIRVGDNTAPGAYQLTADAFCRCGGPQASGATANSTYVFVGGHSVYVPMIVQ